MKDSILYDLDEWIGILERQLEKVREYQQTEEEFSRGYFQGMETETIKSLEKLDGIMNRYDKRK